jgi:hypothetical protein
LYSFVEDLSKVNLSRREIRSNVPNRVLSPSERKNYIIDIDGVICENVLNENPGKMKVAKEIPEARKTINKWFDQGHRICFFTSRTDDHKAITETWLRKHRFKYHRIVYNKPRGGNYHYVDDKNIRATRFKGKFGKFVRKRKVIEVLE